MREALRLRAAAAQNTPEKEQELNIARAKAAGYGFSSILAGTETRQRAASADVGTSGSAAIPRGCPPFGGLALRR
jgi:hypothetical protein